MKRHQLLVSVAVVAVVTSTAACATATDGDPTGSVTIVETPGTTGEPDEPVMLGYPEPNWDAPVVGGVEVTAETAQEVAGAAFDVYAPTLPNGTLLLIQATDPAQYPEDFRGYGVLYDVTTEDGPVVRLFIEETPVGVGEEDLAREMATNNGPGFDLEVVDGVEVVFIQQGEQASAIFLRDGVKYNMYGPALPMSVVRDAVAEMIAQG